MSDKKPLYKQIMDKLKERIKSGDFEYDAPFVTEDRITKEYGVSRITAIRALEELEHDGLINRKRGSGSFVSKYAMSILGKNKEDNAAVTIHKKNRDISLVALVMPFDIKLGNMFKCFDGINSVLNKENCFVSIYNANRSVENEEKILRSLLEQGIDGVICYPVRGGRNFEVYNQFLVKKIPLVLIDNYIENMPMSYIVSDNSGGGKALCEYALEHGHKKIGFFCRGRVNETISIRDRYMGYAAALEEKGLGVNLDYVYANIDDKYEMLTEEERQQYGDVENYLKTIVNRMHEQGISCVLCQNDWVAIQVYNCCKALDISVPNEMCIMGFDNISELDEMDGGNKIITVEQNFFELGVKAGETVLREINGEMPGIKYIVPVKIAVRN